MLCHFWRACPISSHLFVIDFENRRPKKCGLNNVGNTCYMNAALQCLFCTTELSHFFLRGFYKKEFNMHNPLDLQGSVAETFKLLLDDVHSHTETWAPRKDQSGRVTHSVEPSKFKRVIAKLNGGMFAGYHQQDSQELLGAVLDGIHEDCNRVKNKPFVENVVGDGTNDTDIAREAWDRCKMRNDSFVVDTFQGQLRSRVTCTECHSMSVSFDPSMYLGLSFKQVAQPLPVFARRNHLSVFFVCRF
jgi:ubiquitin C-terminal hydrolase